MAATALLLVALGAPAKPVAQSSAQVRYLYDVATPSGIVKGSGLKVTYDPEGRELYALGYGLLRFFNTAGMEVYVTAVDDVLPTLHRVAPLPGGDVLGLSEGRLYRLNFRAELIGEFPLTGVPDSLLGGGFHPFDIAVAGGLVYLADYTAMKVVAVDVQGVFQRSWDFRTLFNIPASQEDGFGGFGVGPDGTLLATIAALFRAYVVSPDGRTREFGKAGSAPGLFSVVSGIAADDRGNIYVVDTLKCMVLIFDPELQFVREFGGRGYAPGWLIAPRGVAVGDGQVFVSQYADRGVSVYRVDWKGN